MPADELHTLLNEFGIAYETHEHRRVGDAQRLAAQEASAAGTSPSRCWSPWGRPRDGGGPCSGARRPRQGKPDPRRQWARLATEDEFRTVFDDCEVGTEPPFGNLYGIPVFLDEQLRARSTMVCHDGSHTESILLAVNDYVRAVQPKIADLATPAS